MLAYAEDILEDEADVEGEADVEEVGIVDEEDESTTTSSPNAYTSLLFVRPVSSGASQMGKIHNTDKMLSIIVLILQKSLLAYQ